MCPGDRTPHHAPVRVAGGVSGAPPTETGPTGLGSGGACGVVFRDVRMMRARGLEGVMLPVVSGAIPPCSALTCADSDMSWRDIRFRSAC